MVDSIARRIYENEPGGHRWQRIPPTEKKGRVHTSTVTVACLYLDDSEVEIDLSQVQVRTTKDSGPGGQHRNKTESCVVMTDKKTGITVKSAKKSQHQNRDIAKTTLVERIRTKQIQENHASVSQERKEQVGTGMRGDKVRTYRTQDNQCINHLTSKKVRLTDIEKGSIDKLW